MSKHQNQSISGTIQNFTDVGLDLESSLKEIIDNSVNNTPSDKMSYLLYIAKKLHNSVQGISHDDISLLYSMHNFTSHDVNEFILIISSFCMFNRYVDGLGIDHALNDEVYYTMGQKIVEHGYL